ncbi:MAG: LysR family transcriptional regulator, partial [Gammaproteobacteria bacterium]
VLNISQSTLSDVITRVETSYGAVLFERDRRGSHPTMYGKVVIEAALQALRLMEEAHREIGLIKGSASGRLAIGAEPGLIEPFLTSAIARGLRRYPNLRFRLQAVDSITLVQEVREKRIDFFFGIRPDVPSAGLMLREIGTIKAAPFVRPNHPLTGTGYRTLGKIMTFPIVQGPGPRWFLRRIGEELRIEGGNANAAQPDAAVIVNDFGVVRAIVRETDAVGFATSAMLQAEVANGDFVQLRLPAAQAALLQAPMMIGTLTERVLPPAAQRFIAELEEVVATFAEDK